MQYAFHHTAPAGIMMAFSKGRLKVYIPYFKKEEYDLVRNEKHRNRIC